MRHDPKISGPGSPGRSRSVHSASAREGRSHGLGFAARWAPATLGSLLLLAVAACGPARTDRADALDASITRPAGPAAPQEPVAPDRGADEQLARPAGPAEPREPADEPPTPATAEPEAGEGEAAAEGDAGEAGGEAEGDAGDPLGAAAGEAAARVAAEAARIIELPGIRVRPADAAGPGWVRLETEACLDEGWLEQVACGVGTREHESLVVVAARASDVHAALLLAGLEPGRPGRWSVDADGRTRLEPPVGDAVRMRFEWTDADGREHTASPVDWIVGEDGGRMPEPAWRFGGSLLIDESGRRLDPDADTPAARYVADLTGSIVGLVTFGDEVVGLEEVIPDATDYAEPAWMVDTEAVPPVGTPVTLVFERAPED